MANAPWARLTNPISPMVTDRPTETMKSTVPAASPPNKMLAKSIAVFTDGPVGRPTSRGRSLLAWGTASYFRMLDLRWSFFRGTRPDRLCFALIFHVIDLADDLLVELPV